MSLKPYRKPFHAAALGLAAVAIAFLSYASQSDGNFAETQIKRVFAAVKPEEASSNRTNGNGLTRAAPSLPATAQLNRSAAVRKSPSTEKQIFGAHLQQKAIDPSKRLPHQSPLSQWADTGYDHASMRNNVLNRPSIRTQLARAKSTTAAAAACDTSQFGSLSGNALVSAIKAADTTCINELFNLSGSAAYNTFREAQMVSVANGLYSSAASYNGTNSDSTLQLILFLRAGYYVQFYETSVGTYGASLKNALRPALDAFANNSNFGLVNNVHGEILAEFVTLTDSSSENARYLYLVKRLLDSYNSSYNAHYWMKVSVNNAYLVTFRGHYNADFVTLVQSDTSIVDTLYNFANRNFSMLGLEDDYLVSNAGRELARFLQYTGSLKSLAQSRAKALVDRSSVTGPTAKLWVGIGEMVDYYDKANCGYYNLCNFAARVETAALPISHTCSSTLRIRAQSMSSAELSSTCAIVGGEEGYFHQKVASGNIPVANDNNTSLEMVIFDSSTDYGTYAGAIYGIDTNNGGMYLEGNPAAAGNQARFIAYEAEWMPTFEIWNLTHEYIHYLDGRFNMYGDFNAAMDWKTVWWIEGFAEYMSYSYRNLAYSAAQNQAALGTYSLSTIYQNDYNSGQTRVYNWGYLAVRFMFEQRRNDVSTILSYLRPGNYSGYTSFMNSIATSNNTAFANWLPCVANPSAPGCGGPPTNTPPAAGFSFTTSGLTATFTDASSDSDGSIASRSWNFGDGTSSSATNPSKTYGAAGTYTVVLTVTDNQGATGTRSQSVTVTGGTTPPQTTVLSNGVPRTGLSAATGAKLNFALDVPAGATNLKFVMSGGSGDADLYVKFGSAPTSTVYDCRPYAGGNAETCTITTAQAGRYYVMLNAYAAFSGVSLTGSYTGGGGTNTPPVAGFSFTTNGLTANFTDSSTDANGTIASRTWNFGDGTSSIATNPSKTYTAAGTYTVQLIVTDNQGSTNTISKSVTVAAGGGLPECTGDPTSLGKNCARSNLSGSAGNYVYMYVYIPQGTSQLRINASGGTGNADLYVSTLGSWATTTSHNYRSTNGGNTESVTVNNPPSGYVYISLYGASSFNGVKVTTQY